MIAGKITRRLDSGILKILDFGHFLLYKYIIGIKYYSKIRQINSEVQGGGREFKKRALRKTGG